MTYSPLPQQHRATSAPLGPVLVVAGPGAGKTFCLIGRVNHLIAELGFAPDRILAVTFTNRAAEEIATRLKHELAGRADEVKRGTLHALCLEILRDHAQAAGLKPGFGVADEPYQRTILARLGVPPKRRNALLTLFGRRRLQKYRLQLSEEELYREYIATLARKNTLDFDGLIAECHALLMKDATISAAVAARWDYVLVDEFQDLNASQYEILKQLTPHRNFFAVGDDEQSIFSWTGADSKILLRFKNEFGIEDPIILDKNLRNSEQIFEAARRLVAENPQIFRKELTADARSRFDVVVHSFPDESAEAEWLLQDLQHDVAAHGRSFGDYAILCRKHRIAQDLELKLVNARIPCRLARGRSLADDDVVGWVIGALRVMRDPQDDLAVEAFAERVFSPHLLEEVRAYGQGVMPFLDRVRAFYRARPSKKDPDGKNLWKFVVQVENLAALAYQKHRLPTIITQLLSQRGTVGRYRNVLEDRHDELTDPAGMPEAVALAEQLERALESGEEVTIEPAGGLEIALRGMLIKAGFRRVPYSLPAPPPTSTNLHTTSVDGLTLFKALQLIQSREVGGIVDSFVAFDFETTDNEVASCDIVELGVVRVRQSKIVEQFHTLVRPSRPISPGASKTHGYTDADVAGAPTFADVWPAFRAFVGNELLVAHNGQYFDVPLLRRLAAGWDGLDSLVFYDTLPLARSLSPQGASLASLAARYQIDPGREHHALDDAITLAQVFTRLEKEQQVRARKAVFSNGLDWLGLALALERPAPDSRSPAPEVSMLKDLSRFSTLRSTDCIEGYAQERDRTGVVSPPVEEIIDRLGGQALMMKLRAEPDPAQRYPAAVARLNALIQSGEELSLEQALDQLLEKVALSSSDGADVAPNRVNLLTLHSTKGLEFSRVYIVGVEDNELPGYNEIMNQDDDLIQEARRLLYVGMTRAKDRLVLTRADQRFGKASGRSLFLEEMGLVPGVLTPGSTGVSSGGLSRTT